MLYSISLVTSMSWIKLTLEVKSQFIQPFEQQEDGTLGLLAWIPPLKCSFH